MQRVDAGQPYYVFVDFTVSPAAYENILRTVRQMCPKGGRILVLTGSCGDRMREKRSLIGQICSQHADVVVVTQDESYSEPYERVIADVAAGVDLTQTELHTILDRRAAIDFILSQARRGDYVLICGMGGTTTMMTLEGQVPWNEVEIVETLLRKQQR